MKTTDWPMTRKKFKIPDHIPDRQILNYVDILHRRKDDRFSDDDISLVKALRNVERKRKRENEASWK